MLKTHRSKMKIVKLTALSLILSVSCFLSSCEFDYDTKLQGTDENGISLTFEAQLYDNSGNNYVSFKGNNFNISPNKIEQYGYNTDGSWSSWYETSSVVSIEIDGNSIATCGSTVIFKDTRIEIQPLDANIGTLQASDSNKTENESSTSYVLDYLALTHWWFNNHKTSKGGSKIVLIQSQDGYNIGVAEGNNVTWEVAEKLPKTTCITIDGKSLYIHRCNFTIIDTKLFDNVVEPEEAQ